MLGPTGHRVQSGVYSECDEKSCRKKPLGVAASDLCFKEIPFDCYVENGPSGQSGEI